MRGADAEAVYDPHGYDADRALRGFTRPVERVSGRLRQLGKIVGTAVPVLEAQYPPGGMRASGFSVHPLSRR